MDNQVGKVPTIIVCAVTAALGFVLPRNAVARTLISDAEEIGSWLDVKAVYLESDETDLIVTVETYEDIQLGFFRVTLYMDTDQDPQTGVGWWGLDKQGLGIEYKAQVTAQIGLEPAGKGVLYRMVPHEQVGWVIRYEIIENKVIIKVPLDAIGSPAGINLCVWSSCRGDDDIRRSFTTRLVGPTITVDGYSDEWVGIPPIITDPVETVPPSWGDLIKFYITGDDATLYGMFEVSGTPVCQLASGVGEELSQRLHFLYDTDNDPTTGEPFGGIGAEISGEVIYGATIAGKSSWLNSYRFVDGTWQYIYPWPQFSIDHTDVFEFGVSLSDFGIAPGSTISGYIWGLHNKFSDAVPDTGYVAYESPEEGVIHLVSYHSQDETNWCALASLAMLLGQYNCRANYETHSEHVKPWDVASYMGWPPEFGFHAFLANVFPKLNPNFLEPEFGLTLKVLEYRPWLLADELDLFWGDLESVLESGKLAMLGLSTLRHAVVISGYDENYVYVNDPNPYGSQLYKEVMGTMPDYSEAHMVRLPKEDLSEYLSSGAISLYWLEGEDPAITSGRATIWLGGENSRSLRFVDPGNIVEGVAKVTLELAWNGMKPFGYMYSKVPQKKGGSGVPRIRNNELGWAALPSEALRLWAAVANPEAQERQFTVVMTITRISDKSLCFQKESEPFPIKGKSRAFETWRLVPLVEPDDGLILTEYLPIEDLRGSAESAVGEYLLRLELRSSSGMEDWVYIRFNVAERPGHKSRDIGLSKKLFREAFSYQYDMIEEAAGFTLFEAAERINELDPENFNNEYSATALTNEIYFVLSIIDDELYTEALYVLENDILERTNGCADIGEPDENDWITTYEGQGEVYPLIVEAIELLESLIQ